MTSYFTDAGMITISSPVASKILKVQRRFRRWPRSVEKKEAGHYSGLSTRTMRKFLRLDTSSDAARRQTPYNTHGTLLLHPNNNESITHSGFLACHHFWLQRCQKRLNPESANCFRQRRKNFATASVRVRTCNFS